MKNTMRDEMLSHLLGNIVPFWLGLIDREYGGFYGLLTYDLKLDKKAVKGCILNSRILWFFSNASMTLKRKDLLEYADMMDRFARESRVCIVGHDGILKDLNGFENLELR